MKGEVTLALRRAPADPEVFGGQARLHTAQCQCLTTEVETDAELLAELGSGVPALTLAVSASVPLRIVTVTTRVTVKLDPFGRLLTVHLTCKGMGLHGWP